MKIKAVCEATGLSDRAVRYYIEEGLISPSFSENYLGRRTFDFSGEDVRALERIAVLRRYDFSVDEIRLMTARPDTIEATCAALISRKRECIANDSDALSSLERTLEEHPKSLVELVSALSAPKAPLPKEDSAHFFPNKAVNILLTVVCVLPVVEAAIMFILAIKEYRYTVFNALSVIIVCACLIPSILSFILPRVLNGSK
ncbi:MAG: MerR family transcriptional regulator, partial [Clostridia bacterium]|nr:MerR family transcriptional regulator [Clostridia bacterium]